MFKDQVFRKSIIASIIASLIFVIFLNPILSLIWDGVLLLGGNLYNGLIDRTYSNAALGQRNWYSLILLVSLGTLGHGVFTSTLIKYVRLKKRHKLLKELEQLENQENLQPQQLAVVEDQVNKIEESDEKFSNFVRSKVFSGFTIVFYLFFSGFILYLITTAYVDLQINTSFKQRSTVLAPLITDQEEEELLAKWASMETRNDYLSITELMDSTAHQHNIILPEPLMK